VDEEVRLDRIGQIRINVRDLTGAVRFYREVLGMRFLFDVPEQGLAFFDCGGVRLYLGATASAEATATATIYYRVDSVERAYDVLTSRGVTFEAEPHTVYRLEDVEGRMAFFRDPDGNSLALMAEVPARGAKPPTLDAR
jgi:catechol 2,3-dioxygenase-like lactoylglutathione lyase family enzyme